MNTTTTILLDNCTCPYFFTTMNVLDSLENLGGSSGKDNWYSIQGHSPVELQRWVMDVHVLRDSEKKHVRQKHHMYSKEVFM